MPCFPIHDLSDTEIEQLVVLISRELMGIGITSFAPGPDGGKDAKFEGTATTFPSTTAPASGKFIVQAKHTSSPVASCTDYDFETTLINQEIPKVHWMFRKAPSPTTRFSPTAGKPVEPRTASQMNPLFQSAIRHYNRLSEQECPSFEFKPDGVLTANYIACTTDSLKIHAQPRSRHCCFQSPQRVSLGWCRAGSG